MNKTFHVTFKSSQKQVVTIGAQGPVANVTQKVLAQAQAALDSATQANKAAQAVSNKQDAFIDQMTDALEHYTSVINAQD